MQLFSFPPISHPSAEILILGTMPGAKSLQLNQYYGHGGNQDSLKSFGCPLPSTFPYKQENTYSSVIFSIFA
jgi:hypothetical protein